MFFALNKNRDPALPLEKLRQMARIFEEFPPESPRFTDSLAAWARLMGVRGLSLFLHEAKTRTFLLKGWAGEKPGRFAVAADYEFLRYLKVHGHPVSRRDFADDVHELRQSALLFFQQTASNRVYPALREGEWQALLTADFGDAKVRSDAVADCLAAFCLRAARDWLAFQEAAERGRKLSELGHVKDQLLTNVTHELQTPLNGIIGVAESLLDGADGPLDGALKEHVGLILKSGRELHATVNNILKLTRIEAGRDGTRFERTDLGALVSEVAALFAVPMAEKKLRFEFPAAGEPHEAFVEPDHIRTLLVNLVGNAVKFTPDGGRIAVDMHRNGRMLHVSVADDGIGIDEEKLHLIFEEFYQEDGSHTRVYGGTGLGLAIARKIVALHGGRIWAESRKGEGARFTFTVPLFPV